MNTFIVPATCTILTFWITFAVVYVMVKNQLAPIVQSIKRIERRMNGNQTEDFRHPEPPPFLPPAPRQPTRNRYISVDIQKEV